jgi:hypothetical protein
MTQSVEQIRSDAGRGAPEKPFGPVAAVFFAAGIGSVVLGVLTTLAEANESIKSWLEWSKSVGPLTGKTVLAAAAFLVAWPLLHVLMRDKDPEPRRVFLWVWILVGIAILLTFPTFFQAFAPEE